MYFLSPKISWKTFKSINKKLYPKPDIVPIGADRVIWKLLHERKLNIYINNSEDPLNLTTKNIPKGSKLII